MIINFSGSAADFTAETYAFDLDGDGNTEQVAGLKGGSGYLVLDRNRDGMVNSGKELFGPQTGNGFSELQQYDQDHNGWIDEQGPIFEQLQIWEQDGTRLGQLYSLNEKRVSALLLDSIATQFTVKDAENSALAMIQETGLFFFDNGQPGTLQQVDLVT